MLMGGVIWYVRVYVSCLGDTAQIVCVASLVKTRQIPVSHFFWKETITVAADSYVSF